MRDVCNRSALWCAIHRDTSLNLFMEELVMRAYKAPKPLTSEEKGKLFDRYLNVMEDYYDRRDLYKAGLI